MRIHGIRIEEFRKLRGPVCLGGLGDGLTIIAGDNEEGKSTVLEALRAALFCRHRTNDDYVRALAPFNCDGAQPRVELDFAIGGRTYWLRKAFCRKPREALLTVDGKTYKDDAAEEELCRILGLAAGRKGATRPEEHGVWGLLWVSQATTFQANASVGDAARATLAGALEEEIGRVLGDDDAPALLDRVRRLCEELFTPTRRPKKNGELDVCLGRRNEAKNRVEELQPKVAAYQQKVEHLQRLRDQRRQHDQEQTLARALAALQAAQEQKQRIELLVQDVNNAQRKVELADAKFAAAREPWTQRTNSIKAAQATLNTEQLLAEQLAQAQVRAAPLRAQRTDAESALGMAQVRSTAAEGRYAAADLALRVARTQHDVLMLREALDKAEAAEAAAAAALSAAATIAVDDDAIVALRRRVGEAGEARARLDAAQTEVRFTPQAGRRIFHGEREIASEYPLRLSDEITLQLEGFGAITIRPGGDDLGARQQAAVAAAESLARLLATLDVADAASAEATHARRRQLLADADTEQRTSLVHAPSGPEALREAIAAKEAELAGLSPVSTPPVVLEAAQAEQEAARAERDAAALSLSKHRQHRDACAQAAEGAERELIELQAQHAEAVKQAREQQEALAKSRSDCGTDGTLLTALKDEEDNVRAARLRLTQAKDALSICDPDAAALRLEDATRAVDDTRALLQRLDDEALERAGELRGLGQRGLEEELAAAQGALERAQRELAAVERRAAALRLLYDTLREAEGEARRSFAEPITRRIQPYLHALFPGCELAFAPDMSQVLHLRRDGFDEPYRHLSVGTREQLAVLTRLAFAELLGERGQPAVVILDDALVYSDRARLARMQKVLLRAAERMQIIVLTCRPDDYAGLGVPMRRLADCFVAETVA